MPLPAREHPASSCLLATERSLCPHVIAESLCGRNTDLGPEDPSHSLGKARRRVASLQLLRLRARASTLLFKGGDQPRHGAIITPAPRVRQNRSLQGLVGGGARAHVYTATLALEAPTLPEEEQSPAGESGLRGLTPARQPRQPGTPTATAPAGFWKPDPGQRASRQAPNATAAPRHTGQPSRPRATGGRGSVFSLPGRASAKPDHGRPPARPRLRWGLSSWGWLFQQPQRQRGPAAGLTGGGGTAGPGPLVEATGSSLSHARPPLP